jgi:hypothetical protein
MSQAKAKYSVQRMSDQLYAIANSAGERVGLMVFNPRADNRQFPGMHLGAWDISRVDTGRTLDCREMDFKDARAKALKLFAALNPPAQPVGRSAPALEAPQAAQSAPADQLHLFRRNKDVKRG